MDENTQTLPIPPMNLMVGNPNSTESPINDNDLLNIYSEIMGDLRNDRKEIDCLLNNFVEMVMNEGDSSSASKEAYKKLKED